jgi:hypothetical protein
MTKLDVVSARANFNEPHELVHASDGKIHFVRRWDSPSSHPGLVDFQQRYGDGSHIKNF